MSDQNKMLVRALINDSLEFLIKESIYYRSYNENLVQNKRSIAWHIEWDNGKIYIP
jgi:hypothetical protein